MAAPERRFCVYRSWSRTFGVQRTFPCPSGAPDGCVNVVVQAMTAMAEATKVAGTMYFSQRFTHVSVAAHPGRSGTFVSLSGYLHREGDPPPASDSRLAGRVRHPRTRMTVLPHQRGSRMPGIETPDGGSIWLGFRQASSSLSTHHCRQPRSTPPGRSPQQSPSAAARRAAMIAACCLLLRCGVLPGPDGSCLDHGQDRIDVTTERHQRGSDIYATLGKFCLRNLERNIDCGRQSFGGDFVGFCTGSRMSASRVQRSGSGLC